MCELLHREFDFAVVKHRGVWALRSYDGMAFHHRVPWGSEEPPTLGQALAALAAEADWRAHRMAA